MPTDGSTVQLAFEGFEGRQVVGAFDGGAVASNGGAVLLREADRAIGLTVKAAAAFRDGRDPDLVVHVMQTLVAQRVHGIALDDEDLNDHDTLRRPGLDPGSGVGPAVGHGRAQAPGRGDAGWQIDAQPAGDGT